MKVYGVSGWAFDDAGPEGEFYYRSRTEAMTAAMAATAPDDRHGGSEATVTLYEVPSPVSLARVVALLNATGWCPRSEVIAVVRNGRLVPPAQWDREEAA